MEGLFDSPGVRLVRWSCNQRNTHVCVPAPATTMPPSLIPDSSWRLSLCIRGSSFPKLQRISALAGHSGLGGVTCTCTDSTSLPPSIASLASHVEACQRPLLSLPPLPAPQCAALLHRPTPSAPTAGISMRWPARPTPTGARGRGRGGRMGRDKCLSPLPRKTQRRQRG